MSLILKKFTGIFKVFQEEQHNCIKLIRHFKMSKKSTTDHYVIRGNHILPKTGNSTAMHDF